MALGLMRLQQARRTNPYPLTWELPVAGCVGAVLVMVVAAHGARSVANAIAGAGWDFTARSRLFTAMPGLLGGDATAGMAAVASPHASPGQLWLWLAIAEIAVLFALMLMLRSALHRWGPGRIQGMATAAESAQLLGLARVRRNAPLVRPDLYGGRRIR